MNTTTSSDEAILQDLESFVKHFEERGSDASLSTARAIRTFLTAMEYDDPTLRESSLEEAKTCFIDLAEEQIQLAIKGSKEALAKCEELMAGLEGKMLSPNPRLDKAGEFLQELVRLNLKRLLDFKESLHRDFKGIEFAGEGPLRVAIQRWRDFQDAAIKPWPWTTRTRKPVDRQMLAQAKADRERGERGLDIEETMKRLQS